MALTQVSTGGIKDGQVHTADLADSQITAGKLHADALDHTYTLGASGTDHYTFTGEGLTGAVNDPTLYLTRGKTYRFVNGNSSGAHPFRIQSVAGAGGTEYNTGVTNNAGAGGSTIIFEVPHDAPDVLYYICTSHATMNGIFYVTGALADGTVTTAKLASSVSSAITANTAKTSNATHTGDVTGSTSLTIANDAVTYAKIQNVTQDRILGRQSSGSGDVQELNAGNVRLMLNVADGATADDLTALSASNLTSGTIPDARLPATLPAISGANLTNLPAGGQAHNLIINGAMQAAQRGTSSTTSGYGTVDRFEARMGNVGVTPTQSQISLTSSDTGPWEKGFRNALRIALPSAGTANTNAEIQIRHKVENQDMANSGWNYSSSSDYVTLSFWFRCSTNQTFYLWLYNSDSGKVFALDFTASGNNTWTKITKQIKGAATLVFGDNNGEGLAISIFAYNGTSYTNNAALNTWQGYSGSNFFPDMATTWVTAGASTFDVTGVQLQVGDTASDFAHENYADTLAKCQRYYYVHCSDNYENIGIGMQYYSASIFISHAFPTTMRVEPTMESFVGTSGAYAYEKLFSNTAQYTHTITHDTAKTGHNQSVVIMAGDASRAGQAVRASVHWTNTDAHKFLAYDAEL